MPILHPTDEKALDELMDAQIKILVLWLLSVWGDSVPQAPKQTTCFIDDFQ